MPVLSPPTWKELDREIVRPVGPFVARAGRCVWKVIDSRTGAVRSTCNSEADAEIRADELNARVQG